MSERRVFFGALWSVGAHVSKRVLDFAAVVIMARILVPADFGLVAIAATVMVMFMTVAEMPLSDAILQIKDIDDEHYDSAFTLGALRGLLICVVLLALAAPVAVIYGDDRLALVLRAFASVPLLRGVVSPRIAHFTRQMNFVPEFVIEVASKFGAFIAAVGIAYLTGSYWAIVFAQIMSAALYSISSYLAAPYRPRPTLARWRSLVGFTGWITLQRFVNVLNFYCDRLLIGGWLSQRILGLYALGSDWAALATQMMLTPISRSLFPAMASINDDPERTRRAYASAQSVTTALLFPVGIGVALIAQPFILVTVGAEWLASAIVIQVLAPVFAVQALAAPAQALALARGRTRSIFQRDLINLVIRLPLVIGGLMLFGVPGVLAARVIAGLNITYLNMRMVGGIAGISVVSHITVAWRSLASGLVMAGGVLGLQWVYSGMALDSPLILLAASVVAGIALYVGCHGLLWLAVGRPTGPESRALAVAGRVLRGGAAPQEESQ